MVQLKYVPVEEDGKAGNPITFNVFDDQYQKCAGLLVAIGADNRAIKIAGKEPGQRKAALKQELPRLRLRAMVYKALTLCCGGILIFNLAPNPYARVVGVMVSALAILDYVSGNHRALLRAHEESAAVNAILDFASEARHEQKMSEVIGAIAIEPGDAFRVLTEFHRYLQAGLKDMNDKTVDVRKRLEKHKADFAHSLAPPQPTAAIAGEGKATKIE